MTSIDPLTCAIDPKPQPLTERELECMRAGYAMAWAIKHSAQADPEMQLPARTFMMQGARAAATYFNVQSPALRKDEPHFYYKSTLQLYRQNLPVVDAHYENTRNVS